MFHQDLRLHGQIQVIHRAEVRAQEVIQVQEVAVAHLAAVAQKVVAQANLLAVKRVSQKDKSLNNQQP